jgi:hypothetical protein
VDLQNLKIDILKTKYETKLQLQLGEQQKRHVEEPEDFHEPTELSTYDQFNFTTDPHAQAQK